MDSGTLGHRAWRVKNIFGKLDRGSAAGQSQLVDREKQNWWLVTTGYSAIAWRDYTQRPGGEEKLCYNRRVYITRAIRSHRTA